MNSWAFSYKKGITVKWPFDIFMVNLPILYCVAKNVFLGVQKHIFVALYQTLFNFFETTGTISKISFNKLYCEICFNLCENCFN